MPSADLAAIPAPYPPLALQPPPLAGEGVTCCQAHPPSAHLVCDTHKAMQDGRVPRAFKAANGYSNGWLHYLA